MTSEMGNITELAIKAIKDDQFIETNYSTAEQVLDYLIENKHFKSLSDVLKEVMIKASLCDESSSQTDFINSLYDRLAAQDKSCGRLRKIKGDKERTRASVYRWIAGKTNSIRYRSDVIEICFALGLSLSLATTLLKKSGHNRLNVRNAKDATYMYCILNHRPLSSAKMILSDYNSYNTDNETKNANIYMDEVEHSGLTTIILENQIIENSSWNSDDDFLKTFLIPNKTKFMGYTSSAITEYYILKNNLSITVFFEMLIDEDHLVFERRKDTIKKEFKPIKRSDIPISFGIKSALEKYENSASILYDASNTLKEDMSNTKAVLLDIQRIVQQNPDFETQKQISAFIDDVMSIEGILKRVIYSIKGENGRIRKYGESVLSDSVMKEFPDNHTFENIEEEYKLINEGTSSRKAIILMYYIAYAYEYSSFLSNLTYSSNLFEEMGFTEFFNGLNSVLTKCSFSPLYPGNRFDWLILRSIREFELSAKIPGFDDGDSPIHFFNEVISFSFGDIPDDDG